MANDLIPYEPKIALAEQTYNHVMQYENVKDLYRLQNAAAAARDLAKQAKEPKIHWNHFMALAIWARWKIGKLLPTIPGKGQRGGDRKSTSIMEVDSLSDMGIDEKESHRWQLLARVGEDKLHNHITAYDALSGNGNAATLTFNGCYKLLPRPAAPRGTYDVIIVDPPWDIKKIARSDAPNQEDMDYPVMSIEELIEWGQVNLLPAPDCHLFLWTTQKYLPRSFDLLSEWGFKYICTFVWHKPGGFQPFKLPQYNCEFIIYAHKGNPSFTETKDFMTCFCAPRAEHSAKPDYFYDTIRRVTSGKRIDMFARKERDGFEIWGNEI